MSKTRIHVASRWIASSIVLTGLFITIQATVAGNKNEREPTKPVHAAIAAEKEAAEGKKSSPGQLDLQRSRVYIHVAKTGLGHEHGVEGRLMESTVHLGASQPKDRIVIDMTTFDADTDSARKYVGLSGSTDASTRAQVNANMQGENVLDIANFPTATFIIKSAKKIKEPGKRTPAQYQLIGVFTLRGKTRPIAVTATAEEESEWTHLRGAFSILQSDYGIKPFSKAFGAVGVADRLQIHGDFWIAN